MFIVLKLVVGFSDKHRSDQLNTEQSRCDPLSVFSQASLKRVLKLITFVTHLTSDAFAVEKSYFSKNIYKSS